MKKIVIIVLICPLISFGQLFNGDIGIIDDPDGYTFVRKGKGLTYPVIDTIVNGELFHFMSEKDSEWWKISQRNGLQGFMHKSRIMNIKDINNIDKYNLIDTIFVKEKELQRKPYYKLTKAEQQKRKEFHEETFDFILEMFAEYICETKNKVLFERYIHIIYTEAGSADELPIWALGMIYVCEPDWTLEIIAPNGQCSIKTLLEFGFENIAYGDCLSKKKYKELKRKIKELKKY